MNSNTFTKYEEYLLSLYRSENTVKMYLTAVNQFFGFMGGNEFMVIHAHGNDILRFMQSLRSSGVLPQSVNNKLSALRDFYNFLKLNHSLSANPCEGVPRLSYCTNIPDFIAPEQMEHILQSFCPVTYKQWRGFIAVCVLYYAGLRASEAVDLLWSDIDEQQMTVRVQNGKGYKERIVHAPELIGQLHAFHYLFPEPSSAHVLQVIQEKRTRTIGAQITTKELRIIINAMLTPLVPDNCRHPHALRHSAATRWAAMGHSAEYIAKQLGHSDLKTSLLYIHLSKKL